MDGKESNMENEEILSDKYTVPNFFGHFLPGCLLISFFFYWIMTTIRHYCICQVTQGRFESIIWPPAPKRWKSLTFYNFIFIFLLFMDILALFACFDEERKFTHMNQLHHIVLFTAFMFHIFIVNLKEREIWLFPNADYISFFLSFAINATIMVNHLNGVNRSPLRQTTHILLAATVIIQSIVILLETGFRQSLTLAIMRSYVALLQGTWICQIAFMQFRIFSCLPEWDENSHHSKMLAVSSFSLHCIVNFGFTVCYTSCLRRFFKRRAILKNSQINPEKCQLLRLHERLN